jgi:hypothetical protein
LSDASERTRTGTHSRRAARWFGGVAAGIAFLVGLTNLIDWISETLDDPAPRPPPAIDARLVSLSLRDRATSLDEYLRSTAQSTKGLTNAELRELGYVFSLRVRLKGGTEREFPLLWTLHRARNGERLRGPLYNQPASVTFVPRAQDHARTWPIWIPYPPRPGSYFVRATLTDAARQPVDERDSERFTVPGVPQP